MPRSSFSLASPASVHPGTPHSIKSARTFGRSSWVRRLGADSRGWSLQDLGQIGYGVPRNRKSKLRLPFDFAISRRR